MTAGHEPYLWLAHGDDGIASDWTTAPGDLHFHDYGFDDYSTEIIMLDASYEHRADVKALDWEATHRTWTGNAWQLDFTALETAVQHFLDRGYSLTIAASDLSIFLSDYDAPVLNAHVPEGPPPDMERDADDRNEQHDLSEF